MSPKQRLLIGAIVLIMAASGFAVGRALMRPSKIIDQPIAFNHQKHVDDVGIECEVCHEHYNTSEHSGLPTLEACLFCHEEPVTELPEEEKIRELASEGRLDVFCKRFRLPDNVFYSHRRHVALAKLPCETCHGEIAATTTPPGEPLIRMTMDFCIECHEKQGVSESCTSCHR